MGRTIIIVCRNAINYFNTNLVTLTLVFHNMYLASDELNDQETKEEIQKAKYWKPRREKCLYDIQFVCSGFGCFSTTFVNCK